jgi:hypothetical protein
MMNKAATTQESYLLSPELQRHLWLRFSVFKLLAVPVFILCALYALTTFYGGVWPRELYSRAVQFYGILIVIWGNYEAANVLREEVRSNTWDFQRMSPMSPASMIFGKLFGATSYIWYASLPLLALAVYAWITRLGGLAPGVPAGASLKDILFMVFFMIVAGIAGHAVSFLASFDGMVGKTHYDPRNRQPRNITAFLMGMGVSFGIYALLATEFYRGRSIFRKTPVIEWFNFDIPIEYFSITAVAFFLFWIFMGIYRLARRELMYRTTPICWFLAVGSIALFLSGLVYDPQILQQTDMLAEKKDYACLFYFFVLTLAATYYAVLGDAADTRRYQRQIAALWERNWRHFFENTPQWMASAVWVIGALAVFIIYSIGQGVDQDIGLFNVRMFMSLALSMALFALRDMIVLHILALLVPDRKQTFERVTYYVLVYFLLPAIHLSIAVKNMEISPTSVLGFSQQTTLFHPVMYAGWYYPNFFAMFTASLLPVLVQIFFLGVCIYVIFGIKPPQKNPSVIADKPAPRKSPSPGGDDDWDMT